MDVFYRDQNGTYSQRDQGDVIHIYPLHQPEEDAFVLTPQQLAETVRLGKLREVSAAERDIEPKIGTWFYDINEGYSTVIVANDWDKIWHQPRNAAWLHDNTYSPFHIAHRDWPEVSGQISGPVPAYMRLARGYNEGDNTMLHYPPQLALGNLLILNSSGVYEITALNRRETVLQFVAGYLWPATSTPLLYASFQPATLTKDTAYLAQALREAQIGWVTLRPGDRFRVAHPQVTDILGWAYDRVLVIDRIAVKRVKQTQDARTYQHLYVTYHFDDEQNQSREMSYFAFAAQNAPTFLVRDDGKSLQPDTKRPAW